MSVIAFCLRRRDEKRKLTQLQEAAVFYLNRCDTIRRRPGLGTFVGAIFLFARRGEQLPLCSTYSKSVLSIVLMIFI